jgi:hypothetical protein
LPWNINQLVTEYKCTQCNQPCEIKVMRPARKHTSKLLVEFFKPTTELIEQSEPDGKELSADKWLIDKLNGDGDYVIDSLDGISLTGNYISSLLKEHTSQKDAQIQALSQVVESQKQTADALVRHVEEATKDNVELIKKMREVHDNAKLTLDTLYSFKQAGEKMAEALTAFKYHYEGENIALEACVVMGGEASDLWEKLNKQTIVVNNY